MAFRFDDLVEHGEIDCTRRYAIYGWIKLRGHDGPLRLQLTGRPGADLAGRKFRFESRYQRVDSEVSPDALEGIIWEQIGPPGDFTASHRVRVVDDPLQELMRPDEQPDVLPEIEWKRCLYLEWYSQNGRVVVQLADPLIEFFESDEGPGHGNDASDATADIPGGAGLADGASGAARNTTPAEEAGEFCFEEREANADFDDEPEGASAAEGEPGAIDSDEEDPWGLFPENLLRGFDEQALETDRQIREEGERDEAPPESDLDFFETVIEKGVGEPLSALLGDDLPLPPHDELNDEQVESALRLLLARLALLGVALDMCEHATPRSAYRYLVEEIIPEELGHRELLHTHWIQHFSTWEGCDECAREFEEEWKRRHPDGQESERGTATDSPPEAG